MRRRPLGDHLKRLLEPVGRHQAEGVRILLEAVREGIFLRRHLPCARFPGRQRLPHPVGHRQNERALHGEFGPNSRVT